VGPSSFSVSGNVSGLLGAGLVLRNNGGDDLLVTQNGSFRFATRLPVGYGFSVSVAQQPTYPDQYCTVANGTGVGSANVTNVAVECGPEPFVAVGNLAGVRRRPAAVRLTTGKVLLVGGYDDGTGVAARTGEIYDPLTRSFSAAGVPVSAHVEASATLLGDGTVLVAGSIGAGNAERYHADTDSFSSTESMVTPRFQHAATLLPDGKVLFTGGRSTADMSSYLSSAEVFDPGTATFAGAGAMTAIRATHTATALSNGLVLIAGGSTDRACTNTAEVYNPATGIFTPVGPMAQVRCGHLARLLPNGEVLMTGGSQTAWGQSGGYAEIYDPTTGTFKPVGYTTATYWNSATLLPDGLVLVAGGSNGNTVLDTAELYDPAQRTFTATATLTRARTDHAAVLLDDGTVLLAGGIGDATAEVYTHGR
jgi:hypothetical protein